MSVGLPGWPGSHAVGERPRGVHPTAEIGGMPEHPQWHVGDPILEPDIDESALIHAFVTVDGGMPGYSTTYVGAHATLLAHCHIGHNAQVEEGARVCNHATVCGHATIGAGASVSAHSWVRPWLHVGEGAIVGGGSVVTKDIPPHEVWAGNPARFLKLTWTHPDYQEAPSRKQGGDGCGDVWEAILGATSPADDHPYHDPDRCWELMRP